MIQHQPPVFRQDIIAALRAAVDQNEGDPQNYALVYDRLQHDIGKPQLYGEQLECSPVEGLRMAATQDEAGLNDRRAAMGLLREEAYIRLLRETASQFCPPATLK